MVGPLGLAACGGGHGSPRPSYTLSGSVSHLEGGALTVSDGSESLTISQGATGFAFQHPLPTGTAYNVAVTAQPSGENCVVSNGVGTIANQNVSNVAITCNSALSAPTTLGVYPADSAGSKDARVFLPVGGVGSQPVTINAVLDTGSAGVDLDAFDVFPSSMVTASGFVFPAGQTSMTYNGITVTNVTAYRGYGGQTANPTRDVGNLGFAQVTIGGGSQVTTAIIPILFVFQQVVNGASQTPNNFTNLIGVNPGMEGLTVTGSPAASTLAPCTPNSTATCGVVSPFRFLTYQNGAREGYELTQVTLHECTISTAGSCTLENALVLGLNTAVSSAFKTTSLSLVRSGSDPEHQFFERGNLFPGDPELGDRQWRLVLHWSGDLRLRRTTDPLRGPHGRQLSRFRGSGRNSHRHHAGGLLIRLPVRSRVCDHQRRPGCRGKQLLQSGSKLFHAPLSPRRLQPAG